jgi:hypothetical protein
MPPWLVAAPVEDELDSALFTGLRGVRFSWYTMGVGVWVCGCMGVGVGVWELEWEWE